MRPVLAQRHALTRAVRGFFDAREFLEVETPAVVRAPALDFHIEAPRVEGLGGDRWLQSSPEMQMKRLLCDGHERIYQLCRAFRRNEVGHLHQPEFTMLEWYRANAGSREVMEDTEALVAETAAALCDGGSIVPGITGPVDVAPPWPRVTVEEAFDKHADVSLAQVLPDEDRFFRVLVDQIEPKLGRGRPVFLTRYPAAMASLAKLTDDGLWADRFEAYVDGVELCNGFGELTDSMEQRRRFEAEQARREQQGSEVYPIDERFMAALQDGMPPSGGNALGVDRMLMLLVGAQRIGDVIAFADADL